jgi:hypothetical protein
VWANWVIVNRTREPQIDEFLPTEHLELDNKTVSLLIEKGCEESKAINFYGNLIQQCQRWRYQYQYYFANFSPEVKITDFRHGENANFSPEVKIADFRFGEEVIVKSLPNDKIILGEYKNVEHRIDLKMFNLLTQSYVDKRYPDGLNFAVWKLLNTYSLLDALSYQWSLPPKTFELLITKCGLEAELFASPLNHHAAHYYSLFKIDKQFGSYGDFFESSWTDFQKGGFYEANPPFIESIFIRAAELILSYLEIARLQSIDLMFMFIMPDWLDSFAYRRLKASSFLNTEMVLRKGEHKYWEYRKDRLIQANFSTHVLILSSNSGYFQKLWKPKEGIIQQEFLNSLKLMH